MSFKAFTNAEEVLNLLMEQFHAMSSPHHTAEERASVRYSWADSLSRDFNIH